MSTSWLNSPPGASLLDLVALQLELRDAVGLEVDVNTYRALRSLLRDQVLTEEIRTAHPDVPWAQIAGMRDKVIHDYMGVDYQLLRAVATAMLGWLRDQVEAILDDLGPPTRAA